MGPPCFGDLGKNARDLFNKGYTFGFLKLDTTTRSGSEVHPLEFKTAATHNTATGKLFGSLDFKYKYPKYGITMTETWNTENVLGSEITVENQGVQGLKGIFYSSFAPQIGKRTGTIRAEYSHQRFHLGAETSLDLAPILKGAVVTEVYKNVLVGAEGGYDTHLSKVTHTGMALGYQASNYGIHTFVNNTSEFGGRLYHKVTDKLELGANLGWSTNEASTRFGIAGKYQLEQGTVLRAKVSNASQIAISLTRDLSPNLKLTLSSLVNLQNFNEGGHKYGMGLEYTP